MIQKPVSLIAGSTGLMGSLIIENLTSLSGSVISLTRNSNNLSKDVTEKIINFDAVSYTHLTLPTIYSV